MSLFGSHTGVMDEITLPKVSGEISRREVLNWERELLGLYVSDHPLSSVIDVLTQTVTHFSGQLSEAGQNEKVRVAGLITRMRSHQTKTGKQMGFVTIEDLQGTIELVIFPRTWEQVSEKIDFDKIIIAEGRVDAEGAEPKVLVDNISTELKVTTPIDPAQAAQSETPKPAPKLASRQSTRLAPASPSAIPPATRQAPPDYEPGDDWEKDAPPPPDVFPPDWFVDGLAIQVAAVATANAIASPVPPAPAASTIQAEVVIPASALLEAGSEETNPATTGSPAPSQTPASKEEVNFTGSSAIHPEDRPTLQLASSESAPIEKPVLLPPYLLSPLSSKDGETVHMITVILRSTGDKTRDVLRMRRIHGIVSTFPGNDRFSFHVFERNRGYLVEFPNFTTGWCPELISKLNFLVGTENVRVEPITFQ